MCYKASGVSVIRVGGPLHQRLKCFRLTGLGKVPRLSWLPPVSLCGGTGSRSAPLPLSSQVTGEDAEWHIGCHTWRKGSQLPGSCPLPSRLPSQLTVGLVSTSLERGAGGAFPQKEKVPGHLTPQSRGNSGPEAPGPVSIVLLREIWK